MKKKIIILAAIAVSGLTAVVASNTNDIFSNSDADANNIEVKNGGSWYFCNSGGGQCITYGHGWEVVITGYHRY